MGKLKRWQMVAGAYLVALVLGIAVLVAYRTIVGVDGLKMLFNAALATSVRSEFSTTLFFAVICFLVYCVAWLVDLAIAKLRKRPRTAWPWKLYWVAFVYLFWFHLLEMLTASFYPHWVAYVLLYGGSPLGILILIVILFRPRWIGLG